jgi:ubiquinone/menaquinone biosynthesis C-methylase UbiE
MLIYASYIAIQLMKSKYDLEAPYMTGNSTESEKQHDEDYYGAGYSVFFREDKLLSYSEIYNWWKMKTIVSRMIRDEKFNEKKEYRILDVGCSRGHDIFRINREFYQYNIRFTGYDLISQDIEYANRFVERKGLKNMDFMVANAENPEFEDNTFDVIICSEVMEHQKKPERVLRECHRILKPNGTMIITTPVIPYGNILPRRLRQRVKKRKQESWSKIQSQKPDKDQEKMPYEEHVFVIKINDWIRILKLTGFEVEELHRGSIEYGGPFFDNHVKLTGLLLIFDNILDHLTYGYSWNIIIKARKKVK